MKPVVTIVTDNGVPFHWFRFETFIGVHTGQANPESPTSKQEESLPTTRRETRLAVVNCQLANGWGRSVYGDFI
jgi:hypothetical protein